MSEEDSERVPAGQTEAVSETLADSFAKVLSRHGYGFQFSVIKKAHEQVSNGKSVWQFVASEFPVEVQGAGTRIDFILRKERTINGFDTTPVFLLAECKKANPALSNWCFVRNRYTHNQTWGDTDYFIMECLEKDDADNLCTYAKRTVPIQRAFHVGVEVRTGGKGESSGETGRAIEDAATQVSRHLNGYIKTVADNPQLLGGQKLVYFMPVIFTTARLFVSKMDISLADLHSGKVELTKDQVEAVPWLYYQYALSPGLKHSIVRKNKPKGVADLLESEYARTIPVVNSEGIDDFLYAASHLDLSF